MLFADLLQMSITGSLCILVVISARLLLRKAPTIYSYALWSIVLFRLICPFTFESPLSFIPADALRLPLTASQAAIPEFPGTFQAPLVQALEPAVQTPAASGEAAGSPDSSSLWVKVIQYVWLAGMGVMIMHSVFAIIRLKRDLKDAVHISGNLYETGRISTPFVMGVLKPRIYLPAGLQEQEKVYIIKHEQVHIRRLDPLIKLIAFAVLCVHWLNPLVWLAYYLMCEDMEKSCDESVIRQLGSGIKQDYSLSLLALSSGRRFSYRTPLAFGEHGTKGRIRNILHYRKPGVWTILLCITAVAALAAGLLGNPKRQADQAEREYARQFIESATGEAATEDFNAAPESRLTGYVTGLAIETETLSFDQVEWLTMEDSDRFAALNISEEDLPGGFYILNKYEINDPYKVTAETEYKLIDREQPGSLKSVSKQEFIAYFKPLAGNAPPCTITVRNGTVTSITEVYVP
nr:M56 family metallopeptidase [Paenibacillus piscarius]